jgi:hypothetical protein
MAVGTAVEDLIENVMRRHDKHGSEPHASAHETWGILSEELHEFGDEVRGNNSERQYAELCDIATAAVVGMASLRKRGFMV